MLKFLAPLTLACALSTAVVAQVTRDDGPQSGPSRAIPVEQTMRRAAPTSIDLRRLSVTPSHASGVVAATPSPEPARLPGTVDTEAVARGAAPAAPPPIASFDGLDRAFVNGGHPPNANGDAGPQHYIQAVGSAVGVYRKSDGQRLASFSFDALMSQGNFGNLCDTHNVGEPVVLYDTFEDRWVLSDVALQRDGGGNVVNPPGAFQCFAVSQSGDPVTGGWYFYSIPIVGGVGAAPRIGVWPDGLYLSVNLNNYASTPTFVRPRAYALNKAQMYAGAPSAQIVSFDLPTGDFGVLPSNARLQTGTPPPGTPNYFVSTWLFLNAVSVYKFHVDWNRPSLSTFGTADVPLAPTSWPNASLAAAPSSGGNALDVVQIRAMMQNQYSNIGGVESLWTTHTVRRANTTGFAAPRWYQVTVTGGTVTPSLAQAATWDPDAANVLHRFIPSLAVNRSGDLALGYSLSSTTTKPAIAYAGRLATDPVNTFGQSEQLLIQGAGTQVGNGAWGDRSSMTLDPDGCTFWYTNAYYAADGLDYQTRIGSFAYPGCTAVGAGGTVSGTITAQSGGAPIAGAVVNLGSRSTTTDAAGNYSFSAIPAGAYPQLRVSRAGYVTQSAGPLSVADGATLDQDFALALATSVACLVDDSQDDFQSGVGVDIDLAASPGDVLLSSPNLVDQANTTVTNSGFGMNSTAWAGQTFVAAMNGQLVKVDLDLFCSGCTGTTPNLTVSIRATTGTPAVPTGPDLATATIPGFNNGAGGYFTATFAAPATVAAGTTYAIVVRASANPSAGTYAYVCSCTSPNSNPYTAGQRVTSANSGASWTADVTSGGRDLGFRVYVNAGYVAQGSLSSSNKDANPLVLADTKWKTLSWNATTPAGTDLQFQVAASNAEFGPFAFVGPDGTAATYFTNGASLSQFNGRRYLRYRATLSTGSTTSTPALSNVTTCYSTLPPPDLQLTKSDGGFSVAPGSGLTYLLGIANVGGENATGVVLSETVPALTTFDAGASGAGWTCTPDATAGSVCTYAVGTIAAGASATPVVFAVDVAATIPAGISDISNTASVTDDGSNGADPTPANNLAQESTPLAGGPNLGIAKSDGVIGVVPGGSVAYTLTYQNAGARGASGVVLSEVVPVNTVFNAGASTAGWICVPDNTAGANCALAIGTLPPQSSSATATFAVTVNASLPAGVTQISNTASIADNGENGTDTAPADNSASDTTPILTADLAITVTNGVTTATPGGSVTYTIVATNTGPAPVAQARVVDTFPATLSACAWTCAGAGGGTCAGAGTGSIDDFAALPNGASATYTATCGIDRAATGTLTNTVNVTPTSGEPDPSSANNSASDSDTLIASADIALTLSDNRGRVAVGQTSTYLIGLTNTAGPSNATVTIADPLPAGLTGGSWICLPFGGATCSPGSGQTLNATVTLPVGGQLLYVYTAIAMTADANDLISNTATAALDGVDPSPGNDTATDTTRLVLFADGFEGVPLSHLIPVGATSEFVLSPAQDAASGSPVETIAIGESARGALFRMERLRFGSHVSLRLVAIDERGREAYSAWQPLAAAGAPLALHWQAATPGQRDGQLLLQVDGNLLRLGERSQGEALIRLRTGETRGEPWIRVLTHD